MADQVALQLLASNGSDKDDLAVQYGIMQGTILADYVSQSLVNKNYMGGEAVRGGTIKVRRLQSAVPQAYGTARTAGAGNPLQNNGVDVKIDTDKEIVEELTFKDKQLYNFGGIGDVFASRREEFAKAMGNVLEVAYFTALEATANVITTTGDTVEEEVMSLIEQAEVTSNDNVNGINRSDMVLTLKPVAYDKLSLKIYNMPNPNGGGVSIKGFGGVEVRMAVKQTADAVLQFRGAVAQPVVFDTPRIENIPLSAEQALYFSFYFGTKVLMPDVTFKADLDLAEVSA